MDYSPKLQALFEYLYDSIVWEAKSEAKTIKGLEAAESLLPGHVASLNVLQQHLTTDESVAAFQRMLEIAGELAVQDMFSILDGVASVEGNYNYALVDIDTAKDLAPANSMYHDEWCGFYMEKEGAIE